MIYYIYAFHQKFYADDEFVNGVFLSQTHRADAFPSTGIGAHVVTGDIGTVYFSTHVIGNDINAGLLQRLWRR